jgi:Cap4, dsDNA endonuclease domain
MSKQAEIFNASNAPGIYEAGGTHGQLGVDFQRYWAITRIIELVGTNQPDFLILFETIQDVMELDSATDPRAARIYQVKKKQTGEWTWKALTGLPPTTHRRRGSTEMTVPKAFTDTPIGKLAAALAELDLIQAEGFFVSNSGCDAELEGGSKAGSLDFCCFSLLAEGHRDEISPELYQAEKGHQHRRLAPP